jgi:homoserine O-succinyltransferase/O-acetyltransferase
MRPRDVVDIGLVNNMPDAALDATERQFRALLGAAAGDLDVRLTLYSLPEVPRGEFGRQQVRKYASIDRLWTRRHDGLIVTGTEPRATDLRDEPYWQSLTALLEWAEQSTYSTILSCLAAHAGILHMDGIERRTLGDKRFGVFECVRVGDHPLTAATSALAVPHSRWNEVPEDALRACGYHVLMRSDTAGVDIFVKQRRSLFVFFQGHPEYEAVTLLLEYRRDVARYLRGERDSYPPLPHGYFDEETERALIALRDRALGERSAALLADFPLAAAAAAVTNSWRPSAERLYRNWLEYIHTAKPRQLCAV